MSEKNPTRYGIAKDLTEKITRIILDGIPEKYAAVAVDESIRKSKDDLIDPIMLAMKDVEVIGIDKLLGEIESWSRADSESARESAKNGVYFEAAHKSSRCDGYQRVVMLIRQQFEQAYKEIEATALSSVKAHE